MTPCPAAVALSFFSTLVILVNIPTLCWHYRNHNIGATSVIVWIIIMNLMIIVNASIWPNDDFEGRFHGTGLCDIESKLQVASQVAFPASFACVLRALAAVMDTEKMTLGQTKAEKRRNTAIDILWCVGAPLLQMPLHYVVQSYRYYVFGIAGCVPAVSNNWVTVMLILVPPLFWTLVCAIYAVIIVFRLYRYRSSFTTILAKNDTNKSRFLRLLLLCILWIFANVPVQCYVFNVSFSVEREPFSWSSIHNSEQWSILRLIPSSGVVVYDRYIWLATGIAMFLFFGFGKEAAKMYVDVLPVLGLRLMSRQRKDKNKLVNTESQTNIMVQRWSESGTDWLEIGADASTLHSKSSSLKDIQLHQLEQV